MLWKLSSSDRDDVVVALVEAVPFDSELRKKAAGNDWLFRGMVNWLIDGPTEDDEAKAIDRLTRAWSGTHRRLKSEGWSSDPAVVAALKAQGATIQSSSDWWASGDFIHDEYAIVMDTMPSGTTPEAYLAEMAATSTRRSTRRTSTRSTRSTAARSALAARRSATSTTSTSRAPTTARSCSSRALRTTSSSRP